MSYDPEVGTGWMVELAAEQVWTGVSGLVVRCPQGHRFGAWPIAVGGPCVNCGSTLEEEQ